MTVDSSIGRWVLSSWRRTSYFRGSGTDRLSAVVLKHRCVPLAYPAVGNPLCRWPRTFSSDGEFAVRLMYSKTLTPGRDAACNVRIKVPAVSRQHAVIRDPSGGESQVFSEYNIGLILLHLVVPLGPPVVHQSHYRQRSGDPRQGPPKEQ